MPSGKIGLEYYLTALTIWEIELRGTLWSFSKAVEALGDSTLMEKKEATNFQERSE